MEERGASSEVADGRADQKATGASWATAEEIMICEVKADVDEKKGQGRGRRGFGGEQQ